jgi:hypothetical protein
MTDCGCVVDQRYDVVDTWNIGWSDVKLCRVARKLEVQQESCVKSGKRLEWVSLKAD